MIFCRASRRHDIGTTKPMLSAYPAGYVQSPQNSLSGVRQDKLSAARRGDDGAGNLIVYAVPQFKERGHERMAQKIQTLLVDDLDGGQADDTVRFGLDGVDYEIDLSVKHAEALRKALAPYLATARRAPGSAARRPGRGGRRAASSNGAAPTTVREWARSQGIAVKDRGRVPADLVARFKSATGQ